MSTRAVYGFKDQGDTHYVYVHHDGYPTGAAEKFANTLASKNVWALPRFEADEFAAGFIAVNKTSQGGVRLTHGPEFHGDIEYYYLVSQAKEDGPLTMEAFSCSFDSDARTAFYTGTLSDFIKNAKRIEAKIAA